MKCLIVLALVAVAHAAPQYFTSLSIPTVLPDGHLADTPDVAVAKIAHFTHHANTLAASSAPASFAGVRADIVAAPAAFAAPVVSHVAAAAPAVVDSPYFRSFYSGPYAIPTVLPSGHLADTPEVAAAKSFHFAEHAKALSLTAF